MIKVEGLTKIYAGNKGIKGITFQVAEGEVFGFLGPNGAGKTTTIRHLMGLSRPQRGQASINGWDCWRESSKVKGDVGYLPGEINFIENMSGQELLNLMAGMHGDKPVFKERRVALAQRFDIKLEQPIKKMSKGMKQKLGIIAAFMLDTPVLILDEPTSGLDPLMQKIFVELVLEEKERGKTIFISSHMFSEVERTCDRVAIIRAGELVAVTGIHDLLRVQQRTFEIELGSSEDIDRFKAAGLEIIAVQGNRLTVVAHDDLNLLLNTLTQVQVLDLASKASQLEEAFMQFYGRPVGSPNF